MSLARAVCANKRQAKLIACRNTNAGHGTDTPKMYIQKLSTEKDIFCPIETTNYSWWFQRFCWAAKFDPKFDEEEGAHILMVGVSGCSMDSLRLAD